MGGMGMLAGFLACGVTMMDALLARRERLTRWWMGLCAGLILMMWLPALYAFAVGFARPAQWLGLATAAALAALAQRLCRGEKRNARLTEIPLWLLLVLAVPFTALSGYLQYTHILRQAADGLHVGQSTYGDLCLHLGIATSLRGAAFPPDYSLLPGTLLGYPFLGDSMVTTMLLFGSPLALSFTVTGTLMMLLVYVGFMILCWEITHSRAATALAFLLMFVNGGLGFLYTFDGAWRDDSAVRAVFTGFYATPTNQPALNLRWVNVICDMMIPQRTLLTGWTALLPALCLLVFAIREERWADFILLGAWAGTMPMIHTHSFLGLGLISLGAMLYRVRWAEKGRRLETLSRFAAYGALAVALALPQLMTWTFPQTVGGGSLAVRFNWVNNQGNGRLIDGYVWFWVKNVGLVWLLMLPAALTGERGGLRRALGLGALCLYLVAELIQFQPNEYDNNKLFYVAFMIMLPAVGLYLVGLWQKLRGVRGRALLAAAFMITALLSGSLSIAREVVSDYRLFSAAEVEAAAFIEENTPADAVFLTGQQHNNAVAALSGRDIVCGTGSYLYFHGVDYGQQQLDERAMLERPAESAGLFERYGVGYVYLSSYERSNFDVDEAWFEAHGELVFSAGDVRVYALSAA